MLLDLTELTGFSPMVNYTLNKPPRAVSHWGKKKGGEEETCGRIIGWCPVHCTTIHNSSPLTFLTNLIHIRLGPQNPKCFIPNALGIAASQMPSLLPHQLDLRVGSSKSTWVDLGLPSGVKSVCSGVTVEIFWRRRSHHKSFQVDLKSRLD